MTPRQHYKAAIAPAIIAKLDRKEAKDGICWHPADAVAEIAALADLLVNDDPMPTIPEHFVEASNKRPAVAPKNRKKQ